MTEVEKLTASLAATNIKRFAILADAMRKAQREYFKTRSKEILIESKSLEKQLDAAISCVLGPDLTKRDGTTSGPWPTTGEAL